MALRSGLNAILLQVGRSAFAQRLIGWIFASMSFAIPVQRLRETQTLLAFHHPSPTYAVHILIVPKRALAGLTDLKPGDADFTIDLFATVQSLVKEFDLERHGFRLICNGGRFQDVPQLHFHLVSGAAKA